MIILDYMGQIISPCVCISLLHLNKDLGHDFILDVYGFSGINVHKMDKIQPYNGLMCLHDKS